MRILAHRGGADHAPENTFAAFDLAIEMRADALETDVRATADGVAVLIHDTTVQRTTDGSGLVAALRWAELERLNASARFDGAVPPQCIPRLDAFLDRYANRIALCIEIKCIEAVAPTIAAIRERGLIGRPDIDLMSFDREILDALLAALPGMRMGWLLHKSLSEEAIAWALSRGLVQIGPRVRDLTPEHVAAARRAGLEVRVWGIKSPEEVAHAVACGVDGITLDRLDWRPDRTTTPPDEAR